MVNKKKLNEWKKDNYNNLLKVFLIEHREEFDTFIEKAFLAEHKVL